MSLNFNENHDDSSRNDEDKYYAGENESINVSYEEVDTFQTNRIRENDIISNEITGINVRVINSNNIILREASNDISNFNLNVYSEMEGNSVSANSSRNFDSQLDEIFDSLSYLISSEKNNLKNDRIALKKSKAKFLDFKSQEVNRLEKEREKWRENLKLVDSLHCKETDILDLDIGGTHKVTTSRSTLIKFPDSALALMFSGRHELPRHNNRIFIDRDGAIFTQLINYLRSGKYPIFNTKTEEINFFEEMEYWQINTNEDKLFITKQNSQFDPEWCASTLKIETSNTVIRKQNIEHGIVFCKTPLDIQCPYIEFKIIMNIPCRGKSHLFIGLVDKSKYVTDHLTSTFWKDSPSSFYWDVWSTKLIKTDENGTQIGTVSGYGCQCQDYETTIGIKYDYKSRSVSFYKNGINQGVAFRNVPMGLTPSLDLWFESGTVEILSHTQPEKIFL